MCFDEIVVRKLEIWRQAWTTGFDKNQGCESEKDRKSEKSGHDVQARQLKQVRPNGGSHCSK